MTTPNLARGVSRAMAAWALVGYTGLYLAFAFLRWVLPDDGPLGGVSFATLSSSVSGEVTALVVIALPLAGTLLATGAGLASNLPQAKLISGIALIEYAVIVVLGALTWLIGLGAVQANTAIGTMSFVVLGLGRLALASLAGLFVYQAWVRLGGTLPIRASGSSAS